MLYQKFANRNVLIKKLFFFPLLFLLSPLFIIKAQYNLDSLMLIIKKSKTEDTNYVNTLLLISKTHFYSVNIEQCRIYANKAKLIAEKLHYKKGMGELWHLYGNIYSYMGNIDTALSLYQKAVKIRIDLGLKEKCADSYNNIALIYFDKGNYTEALKINFMALSIYKELNNRSGIGYSYNNIGNIFQEQGALNEALKYHQKALDIRLQINDIYLIGSSYNNIANIQMTMGEYPKALKSLYTALRYEEKVNHKQEIAQVYNNIAYIYDKQKDYVKALKYFMITKKIREEIKDSFNLAYSYLNVGKVQNDLGNASQALLSYEQALFLYNKIGLKAGVAKAYNNIASFYLDKKDFDKAIENTKKAIVCSQEIGNKDVLISSYQNLAAIMVEKKQMLKAKEFLNKALFNAREIHSADRLIDIYNALSELDSILGDYKSAYTYLKTMYRYRDSVYNEENTKKLVETELSYNFEKKEAEIKLEQAKKEAVAQAFQHKQRIVIISISLGLFILLVFSFFIYKALQTTKTQRNTIAQQKELVEYQKYLVEEQKAELGQQKQLVEAKQKEIIDSITYAKRLQDAILVPIDYIRNTCNKNIFILYLPKDIVAGDFYFYEITKEAIFIAAVDCTGHGVPGAMVSLVCSNALKRAVHEFGLKTPSTILDKAKEVIIDTFKMSSNEIKDGMDISLCKITNHNTNIEWAGAHNPLWIYYKNKKQLVEIKADKQPVGLSDSINNFTNHVISLEKGDIVYLFTDGFQDQFGGERNKKLKSTGMKEIINTLATSALDSQKEKLNIAFENWKVNTEQTDDVCMIGIEM